MSCCPTLLSFHNVEQAYLRRTTTLVQSFFLLVEVGAQAEERERKGARRSKVVVGTSKVVKVGVKVVKVVKVGGEGVAANGASEEEGVSTTHRRKKIFYDYRG